MSMTCRNCVRVSPCLEKRAGHFTIIGLRTPPRWLATCFVHWKGGIHCPGPAGREVVEMKFRSDLVHPAQHVVGGHQIGVEEGILVQGAVKAAFRGRPVIADDVDDHRVFGHPAMWPHSRAPVRLPRRPAGRRRQRPPSSAYRASSGRRSGCPRRAGCPGGEVSSVFSGMIPMSLLALEGLLAIGVPTHVELALEGVDQLLGGLVRGMGLQPVPDRRTRVCLVEWLPASSAS